LCHPEETIFQMRTYKYLFLLLAALIPALSLPAQTIRLARTDADTARDHFVTATYMFGVDVVLDNVSRVNGVAFELRHNMAGSVRFSGWEPRDFPSRNTIVIDQLDTAGGIEVLNVGILNGNNSNQPGSDNPVAIHLDFVVAPDALHNSNLVFTFVNAQAVIGGDSSRIVTLSAASPNYNVHGFVNVWPGDTDNNGVVDTRDVSHIGLYVGLGSAESLIRGFKRQQPSALWMEQPALAWDSTAITYADADGNGTVTARDMLVVLANFGKTRPEAAPILTGGGADPYPMSVALGQQEKIFSQDLERIPIRIRSARNTIGVSGRISFSSEDIVVHAIEPGELFAQQPVFLWYGDCSGGSTEFALGTTNRSEIAADGIAAYLLVERRSGADPATVAISELTGIGSDSHLFPLELLSSVAESYTAEEVRILENSASLQITSFVSEELTLSFASLLGEEILPPARVTPGSTIEFPFSEFPAGAYFLSVRGAGRHLLHPFRIAR